jgi:hypothetical protein
MKDEQRLGEVCCTGAGSGNTMRNPRRIANGIPGTVPPPSAVRLKLTWLLLITESVIVALPGRVDAATRGHRPFRHDGNHVVRVGTARNTSPTDLR